MKIGKIIFYLVGACGWIYPIHDIAIESSVDLWTKFMLILACVIVLLQIISKAISAIEEVIS